MKKITLFCCSLVSLSLSAQFTLTQADFPVAGAVYTLQLSDTTGVLPGNSGTGVTWNFAASNSSVGTMVDSFKTVLSTPYGSSYPQANLAMHEVSPTVNYFVYFNENAASADRVGNADPVNTITYTNPATQFVFPLSYGNTGSDTYGASYIDASSGSTVHIHGTGTMNADGTGTIMLPTGTYNNVMRVHYTRTETDTIFTPSSGNFRVSVTENYYLWYQAGDYYPIFHLQTVANQVASGPVTHKKVVGWRTGNMSAGMTEQSIVQVNVYPNPASEKISIQVPGNAQSFTATLFDVNGKLTRAISANGEEGEMSLSDLPDGNYLLLIRFANGSTETKKIIHR